MRIGITFDLREDYANEGYSEEETAEFDRAETICAIEHALSALGHSTDRIGRADMLAKRLGRDERWDLVFNIAEGMHGFGRQSLVPSMLDAHGIAYTFSDPLSLAVTLHKPTAKRLVRDMGLATPDFAVVEAISDIEDIHLPYPLFLKPVAEGTSKGISPASRVTNQEALRAGCERLLARHRQPVLVETYLPGREFTVGILGTGAAARALGAMEILLGNRAEPEIYSYDNKRYFDERVEVHLSHDETGAAACELALAAWRGLGCRDAGRIDIRCDAGGHVSFLEANPLAGLDPDASDLPLLCQLRGISYQTLIAEIVTSAALRSRVPQRMQAAAGVLARASA